MPLALDCKVSTEKSDDSPMGVSLVSNCLLAILINSIGVDILGFILFGAVFPGVSVSFPSLGKFPDVILPPSLSSPSGTSIM